MQVPISNLICGIFLSLAVFLLFIYSIAKSSGKGLKFPSHWNNTRNAPNLRGNGIQDEKILTALQTTTTEPTPKPRGYSTTTTTPKPGGYSTTTTTPKPADRLILHYHFHKTAGKALCNLAKANGETVEEERTCKSNMGISYDNCLAQQQRSFPRLKNAGISYVRDEFRFNWVRNCSHDESVTTVTFIRHPISRTASGYMFRVLHGCCSYITMTPRKLIDLELLETLRPNFQCRQAVNKVKTVGDLSQHDIDRAISLLHNIDLVVPMERFCEAVPLMREVLGWNNFTLLDLESDPTSHVAHRNVMTSFGGDDDITELTERNAGDIALWNEANAMFDAHLKRLNIPKRSDCPPITYNYIPLDVELSKNAEIVERASRKHSKPGAWCFWAEEHKSFEFYSLTHHLKSPCMRHSGTVNNTMEQQSGTMKASMNKWNNTVQSNKEERKQWNKQSPKVEQPTKATINPTNNHLQSRP